MNLVATYLMGNCSQFVDLTLKSVFEYVDKIIIVYDTSSKDDTLEKIKSWKLKLGDKLTILDREYIHDYKCKTANCDARTFYLDYLKQNYMNEWCLVIDADEVCDDNISKLKDFLSTLDSTKDYLISPKMEHFIGNLGSIDVAYMSGQQEHFVPNRLFNITNEKFYYGKEHPVLNSTNSEVLRGKLNLFTMWHMAYCREMFYIKERYLNHLNKSEIHSETQMLEWFYMHIGGKYPVKRIELTSLPSIIKKEFLIDDEYFYFKDRMQLELKHVMMAHQWKIFFRLFEPYEDGTKKKVLDVGCGVGHFIRGFSLFDIDCEGFDISSYAINNTPHIDLKGKMWVASALDKNFKTVNNKYELVIFSDILEHLNSEEEISATLQNGLNVSKKFFLFSIPWIGNPDLDRDSTHKIKQTRDWWIEKIESEGIKLIKVPQELYYNYQLLIGVRADDKSIKVR